MNTATGVHPGDWFVVDPGTELFGWVEAAERLIDGKRAKGKKWGHAGVATRWADGVLMCVEAEPGGAVERPWRWAARPHLWSTGTGLSAPGMARAAMGYAGMTPDGHGGWVKTGPGVGYSLLDYLAIGAHSLHIPAPGLRDFIADSHRLICSQLVDVAAQDAGIHLYNDSRWNGYVTPLDLGLLLDRSRA